MRLIQGVNEYKSYYGAYLRPDEILDEIEMQRIVLASDQDNEKAALKIARLADCLEDNSQIESVEKDLARFAGTGNAAIIRELGMVRWKLGQKKAGREMLFKSIELDPHDPDALCELGLTYYQEKNYWDALKYYEEAFKVAPNYPRALLRFIECRILDGKDGAFDFIPLIHQNLQNGIELSRQKIEAGIHLPYAWYDIGFFSLLLDRHTESIEAYGKAILTTPSPDMVESVYQSLTELQKKVVGKATKLNGGLSLIRSFLRVVLVGRCKKAKKQYLLACDERLDGFSSLSPTRPKDHTIPFEPEENIVIVAGSCSKASEEKVDLYAELITDAFKGFEGTVCSGGTPSGISGIVGKLNENNGKLKKIAYVPLDTPCMQQYQCIQTIPGTFSRMDPIMLWSDILLSGISPESVRVLGVRGGDISAFEYQLGLILGAKVGVLLESGGASLTISEDPDWSLLSSPDKKEKKSNLL